jgi:hypothetical protein
MTGVVYVITDLGPTDEPGLVVPAELLGPALHGADGQRMPLWYYPARPFEER